MATPEVAATTVVWRIEDWEPGGARNVRAWVSVRSPVYLGGERDVQERCAFGAGPDAEERAVAWVRATAARLAKEA